MYRADVLMFTKFKSEDVVQTDRHRFSYFSIFKSF